jgi:nicotinate-nucleotide adenylyltransferase
LERPSRQAFRPDSGERIGLLGGTFDPPHYGHLLVAQEAGWRLGLARVLFLPARQNPLKQGEPASPAEHRVRMVELAIADNPLFSVSRADLDRPPPSYTVELLRLLREQYGPGVELSFLMGTDLLAELPAWHRPDEVLRLARLVAVARPGCPAPESEALKRAFPSARARLTVLRPPGVDVSSTELRARVRAGHPIRYLTPPAVAAYIHEHGLYLAAPSAAA